MRQSLIDRCVSAVATALIIALLGYMLVIGLDVRLRIAGAERLTLVNLSPPPPPAAPKPQPKRPKSGARSGKASPANLRSKATPVVSPPPVVLPPVPTPVIAAPKPNVGDQAMSGASNRVGPGEGAGGQGNGNGSGGYGDGDGSGGGDSPPRQTKGRIRFSDMPAALREGGAAGTVAVRYHVQVDGHATDCMVTGSSGYRALDALTCQLIEDRFRFRPSRQADGTPVRSVIEESHSWILEPDQYGKRSYE